MDQPRCSECRVGPEGPDLAGSQGHLFTCSQHPDRLYQEQMEKLEAETDAKFEGLKNFQILEARMRKMHCYQIGHSLLSLIGEANHNSWDAIERPELEGYNEFCGEIIAQIDADAEFGYEGGWGFGAGEWWDSLGMRHTEEFHERLRNPTVIYNGVDGAIEYLLESYDLPETVTVDKIKELIRKLEENL